MGGGGAIYIGRLSGKAVPTLTIQNSTFYGNKATGGSGSTCTSVNGTQYCNGGGGGLSGKGGNSIAGADNNYGGGGGGAAVAAPFLAAAMPVTLSAGPPAPSAVEMAVIAAAMGIAQNAPAAVAEEGGRRPTSVALAVRAETEGPAATEAAAEAEVSAITPAATAALSVGKSP